MAVVNRTRWLAWQAFHPTTRARNVFPTPGLPIRTRLVPCRRKARSSRRRIRFFAWTRLLWWWKWKASMLACVCRRDDLKRRSMARPLRDSSSISASSSSVATTLRLRAAASAIVASICRLIAFRFSCCSFCSRGIIGFLSGFENEGVVFQQRNGVSGEFVEQGIAQSKRRLWPSRRPLLAQDVGDIIGSVSVSCCGSSDRVGHIFRAVLPDQFQQLLDLTA